MSCTEQLNLQVLRVGMSITTILLLFTFKFNCLVTSSFINSIISGVNFAFNNGKNNSWQNRFSRATCFTLVCRSEDGPKWSLSEFSERRKC
jgi:hypothetical protein